MSPYDGYGILSPKSIGHKVNGGVWMSDERVREITATPNKRMVFDEKGFFVIYLRDDEIVAEHYQNVNRSNESVQKGMIDTMIVGKSSEAICHTIIREDLISRLEHAAYIGRELQKAEIALKSGMKYSQDEDLIFHRSQGSGSYL